MNGTNRSTGAFSINVCVDNGITGAAIDVDVTSSVIVAIAIPVENPATNRRAGVVGSIIWVGRTIRTKGVDRIYGAAGNVDGCCATIVTDSISNCGNIMGSNSCNIGIFFNIDREIPGIATMSRTDGATKLIGFCMYGGIPGDRNRSGEVFITRIQTAIANGRTISTVCFDNGVIFNRDAVSAAGTAADRGTF